MSKEPIFKTPSYDVWLKATNGQERIIRQFSDARRAALYAEQCAAPEQIPVGWITAMLILRSLWGCKGYACPAKGGGSLYVTRTAGN